MNLYDNDSYRDEFMEGVYALLSDDPTWGRANQIIGLFDDAPISDSIDNDPIRPLSLEELRKMDGEPVWIVEHPDWGHWELSADAEDYVQDRDPDFYGMLYDDPQGKFGLHVLGWLAFRSKASELNHAKRWQAYRHKPERQQG